MSTTPTAAQVEADVREFAATYPGPNTRLLIAYCEEGDVAWTDAWLIAQRAMGAGLKAAAAAIPDAIEASTDGQLSHTDGPADPDPFATPPVPRYNPIACSDCARLAMPCGR